ncbi:hypothetical protein CDAR_46491 [Caerostris darwini]|uniref:Secreted protein n=1 Tax=Caerostris darwini TaxID=1538125 RepID=A0AAV4S285_9ARAC|nr:hypothetical protein CDAR_46491 [Caerostris darwini]
MIRRKCLLMLLFGPVTPPGDQHPIKIRILIGPKSNHDARGVSAPLKTCRIRLVNYSTISLHSSALRLFTGPTLVQECCFLSNRDGIPMEFLLEGFQELQ